MNFTILCLINRVYDLLFTEMKTAILFSNSTGYKLNLCRCIGIYLLTVWGFLWYSLISASSSSLQRTLYWYCYMLTLRSPLPFPCIMTCKALVGIRLYSRSLVITCCHHLEHQVDKLILQYEACSIKHARSFWLNINNNNVNRKRMLHNNNKMSKVNLCGYVRDCLWADDAGVFYSLLYRRDSLIVYNFIMRFVKHWLLYHKYQLTKIVYYYLLLLYLPPPAHTPLPYSHFQ